MLSSRTLRRPVPLNFIAPHFAFGLSAVFGLYAYMQRCEMVFPHVFSFHTGPKLYPYFFKILEILGNPAMARSMKDIEQIKRMVRRLYVYAAPNDVSRRHLPAHVTMPSDGSMRYKDRMAVLIEGSGVDRIFETLQATWKAGCSNVDCPLPEDSAVHAMLCSKCDLVRFCSHDVRVFVIHSLFFLYDFSTSSTQCLKSSWSSHHYPHKKICGKIHNIKANLGADTWSSIWSSSSHQLAFPERKFEQACQSKGIDIC